MSDSSNDFAELAHRYWSMWADAVRSGAAGFGLDVDTQGIAGALDGFSKRVGGNGFDAVIEHFKRQSGDWFAQMQQVAAQFIGRDHRAADVARAWREAFGGSHPFAGLVHGMRGPGLEGIAQWSEVGAPWLASLRSDAGALLGLPAFGFTREHQERAQALGQAQLRMHAAQEAYNALLAKVSQDAHARFEAKLAEHEEPGRQIGSVRALFDLWVDAAEEAWAQAALSEDYRHAFGELANAQMQLRSAAQAIAEQAARLWGLPGRTELDSAHRKIAKLQRALWRMQQAAEPAPAPQPPPARTATRATPASRPAAKKPAKAPAKRAAAPKARKAGSITKSKPGAPTRTAKRTARRR